MEKHDHHYEPPEVHEFTRVGLDQEAVVTPGTRKLLLAMEILRLDDEREI